MEDYSSDELAETRALAKKMLRKKGREEILDMTSGRYAFNDDAGTLPEWFVQEEKRHYRLNLPITKEEVAAERELLRAYNERPSKKVMEAKAKKKMRLKRALSKVRTKAMTVANQTEISEGSKNRQIERMYKKAAASVKEKKKVVVSRVFNTGKGKQSKGSKVKYVDPRMKKDLRAQKRLEKKGKRRRK